MIESLLFEHPDLVNRIAFSMFLLAAVLIVRAWWISNRIAADTGKRIRLTAMFSLCIQTAAGLRISFHVYNRLEDVHGVLEVLKKNIDLAVRD
jgi:selenocysteine lyase/cysteine desulfurase